MDIIMNEWMNEGLRIHVSPVPYRWRRWCRGALSVSSRFVKFNLLTFWKSTASRPKYSNTRTQTWTDPPEHAPAIS